MFESFSAGALSVVTAATKEAHQLRDQQVGTEHLLLGLLSEASEAAVELRDAGASLAAARHMVAEVSTAEAGSVVGESLPFTPRAQRALERAGRFSRQQRDPEVTAGHVLLGVLDVEGLACQVLRGLGVDIGRLRAVNGGGRETIVSPAVGVRPRCPRCRASLDDTLTESVIATRHAGELDAPETPVRVVFCGTCGATVGVLAHEQ